jgi:hypothetical protein
MGGLWQISNELRVESWDDLGALVPVEGTANSLFRATWQSWPRSVSPWALSENRGRQREVTASRTHFDYGGARQARQQYVL